MTNIYDTLNVNILSNKYVNLMDITIWRSYLLKNKINIGQSVKLKWFMYKCIWCIQGFHKVKAGSESALFQHYLATIWLLQIPLSHLSCKVTQTHTHNEYSTKETVDPAEMTCQHLKNGFGSKRFPMILSSKCVDPFEEYNLCRKNTLHVEKNPPNPLNKLFLI